MDDIGIAANDAAHLIRNLRATFECIIEAGLKLTMPKCDFVVTEFDFLGRTITPEGVKPQKKNYQFLGKDQVPEVQEGFTALSWFPQLLQELYTKIIRDIRSIFPITQKGRDGPSDNGTSRTIYRYQQRLRQV